MKGNGVNRRDWFFSRTQREAGLDRMPWGRRERPLQSYSTLMAKAAVVLLACFVVFALLRHIM